jgi:small GTP-binding protein
MVGEEGVGKSSLVRRFVYDEFDDRYLPTLGAKVSKKIIGCSIGGRTSEAVLNIWDIMGTPSFRELLREAYFESTQGILAVADVSRPPTIQALRGWVSSVRGVAGPIPAVVLANKADLVPESQPVAGMMEHLADEIGPAWLPTSAKTGRNVEQAFESLVGLILTSMARSGKLALRS